jgi:DNA-binding NtrC family response regulator
MGLDFIVSRSRVAIKLLEIEASKTGLKDHYSDVEKVFIEEALEKNDNNVKAAAKSLGYEYTTINKKLSKHSIDKSRETNKLVPSKNE